MKHSLQALSDVVGNSGNEGMMNLFASQILQNPSLIDQTNNFTEDSNLAHSIAPVVHMGEKTTMMLRNMPNRYTQDDLLEALDEHGFMNTYDFVYLPVDFAHGCNVGYAFVNFLSSTNAAAFCTLFNGLKLTKYKSKKLCGVSPGRIQGLEDNIRHFRNSPIMGINQEEFKPALFKDGVRIPFPVPEGVLGPVRPRLSSVISIDGGQRRSSHKNSTSDTPRNWRNSDVSEPVSEKKDEPESREVERDLASPTEEKPGAVRMTARSTGISEEADTPAPQSV